MKEIKQISLNGIVFHVEEDGYIVLKKYIDNLERYYRDKEGGREVIEDIQIRMAELLLEKKSFSEQAITLDHVESVIAVMGYPENFEPASEEETKYQANSSSKKQKKLYRDSGNALVAGVCSGLSYYFGIDVWILRIIFVCLGIFSFGFWALVYIVLWFIIPKAETATQRYEMKGESLNVENIEQKIKEELNEAGERVKNFFDKNSGKIKDTAGKVPSAAREVFGVFAKIVGSFLIVFSIIAIVMTAIIWFVPVSSVFSAEEGTSYFCINEFFKIFGLNTIASFLCLLCVLLPLVMLLLLGISSFVKKTGRKTGTFILGILFTWVVLVIFVAIGLSFYVGDRVTHRITTTKEVVVPTHANTITIRPSQDQQIPEYKLRFLGKKLLLTYENDQHKLYGITDFDHDVVYTNDTNVVIRIYKKINKKKNVAELPFQLMVEDSVVYIPRTFVVDKDYWGGEVDIKLFVPYGKKVVFDDKFATDNY